jgi:polyphosphate kinase
MTTVRPAPGPRVAGRSRRRAAREQKGPILNRELSWIEFNARVLHEARDTRNPLLERVKFLAIFASNLDEFFQVRVSGLRRQDQAGAQQHSLDGLTPAQQLDAIRARVRELIAEHSLIWTSIRAGLAAEGVEILDYEDVPEHHETLRRRFHDEIFPVLTPLAVDPGQPFPYISTLSLSIAVGLRDPETGESRFARVKIPPVLPRLFAVERDKFVLLDQVIEANLDELFRGMEILETHLFRVTRDADITIEEDEADDLLLAIEEEVRRRRFGEAVRLEVERSMPEVTRQILLKGIGVRDADSF